MSNENEDKFQQLRNEIKGKGILSAEQAVIDNLKKKGFDVPASEQGEKDGTIIQFLQGSHSFDGVWFGDKHPKYEGSFWWRIYLHNHLTCTPPLPSEQQTDEWIKVKDGLPDGNDLCLFIAWKEEWQTSYASYFGRVDDVRNHRKYDLENHYTHFMIIQPPKK